MIISKQNTILNKINNNNIYIVTDFDKTLTSNESQSSTWASIFKNPTVSKEFVDECIKIYNKYHPLEIDNTISNSKKNEIMEEWYKINIETLIKYKINEKTINYSIMNNSMKFRNGASEFLNYMNKNNIKVIIISAGVGDIIEKFLIKNKCLYSNIYILSNFLKYDNEKVIGIKNNKMIHSLNKNEILIPKDIKEKIENKQAILLGDNIEDINMVENKEQTLKIRLFR